MVGRVRLSVLRVLGLVLGLVLSLDIKIDLRYACGRPVDSALAYYSIAPSTAINSQILVHHQRCCRRILNNYVEF